jgi:hypothetical protein
MKFPTLLLFLTITGVSAETLDDFRWKHRLLVVTGGPATMRAQLAREAAGLTGRDVKIFILDEPEKAPGKVLAGELQERLQLRDGVAEVLLLGKDGQTTVRWKAAEFTVEALFARIDAMPMRRAEMRVRRAP